MSKRIQLFFLDLHSSAVGKNLINLVGRIPYFGKLAFLRNDINSGKIISFIYLGSSLPLKKLSIPIFIKRIIVFIEYILWKLINKYKGSYYLSLNSLLKENIKRKKIIIIDSNNIFQYPVKIFDDLTKKGFIFLFYTSHFHFKTLEKVNFFKRYPKSFFFAETIPLMPVSIKNYLIKKNKYLVVPYVVSSRFLIKKQDKKERNKKILVTGSIIKSSYEMEKIFMRDWGNKNLNPLRLLLYKNRKIKIFKNITSYYNLKPSGFIFSIFKKSSYFSVNLPLSYRTYKYFICGEDVAGFYSSNMCEGMASGCIYFANSKLNYLSLLGMKKWVHYIPHDGTIKGILKSYKKIEKNQNLYNYIKKNSQKFALKNFTSRAVRNQFIKLSKKII